jgi:GT2 family glycosyltransferase
MGQPDLSAVVVTWNDASYVIGVVSSLLEQQFGVEDGRRGTLEIIVVDNHSAEEHVRLLEWLPAGITVIRTEKNLGYGGAANRGFDVARGRYVSVLNPDMRFLPGALQALLTPLFEDPNVGATGPKFWWDDERRFMMPPNDDPTFGFLLLSRFGQVIAALGRLHKRRWLREAVKYWSSAEPRSMSVLCGACIVFRREVLEQVGGFDPGYFLYYDDADWARRARRAGHRLLYVPQAEVVHYYNQSPKANPGRSAYTSEARFYGKHYGGLGRVGFAVVDRVAAFCAARRVPVPPPGIISLGQPEKPPLLQIDGCQPQGGMLIEVSHHWTFLPAAGALLDGDEFQVPRSIWERLQPGWYYARLVDLATLEPLRIWSWQKV